MAEQRDIDRWKKGKDYWNKWARERLKAKEKLEKEGQWAVDEKAGPFNDETRKWTDSASVDFSGLQFMKGAEFEGIIFPSTANFMGTEFTNYAWFREARFLGDAWFSMATFSGNAEFGDAKFLKYTVFAGAVFSGDVNFVEAKFWGNAEFNEVVFSGRAEFNEAKFSGDAWFGGVVFSEVTGFGRAAFSGDADFALCTFNGSTNYHDTTFAAGAIFNSARSDGTFSLSNATFKQVPDFIQMSFRAPARLDDLDVIEAKPFQKIGDRDNAARYRALKKIAIESHDHLREQVFFASELREKRGNDDPVGSPRYLLSFIYELLSNFGSSLKRPIAALFVTWLVMAAAYGTWVPETTRQGCGWITTWLTPEHYLSLLHTLPFVGLVRSGRRELALKCLYGSKTGFGAGTDVLFIAHNTFAAVLIFLFFLAVRNHFKIK